MIVGLRRLRMTAAEIAETLAMPLSTVSVVLRRHGVGKLGRIGLEQPVRYERSRPGELVHIDVKKLGRIKGGAGWRVRGGLAALQQPGRTDARGQPPQHRRLGVRPRRRRRLLAASPTPRYCSTRKPQPPPASSNEPSPSTTATASPSNACSPTTAPPTAASCTPSPAANSASATSAPAPTAHKQTGKPSASSAPCSTAGPTAPSTAQATNAAAPLTAGSGTTTINADTQHSATNHRSAEPTCLGPTPSWRGRKPPPTRAASRGGRRPVRSR